MGALDESSLARDHQAENSAERGSRSTSIPDGALFPWGQRLNPSTTSSPPVKLEPAGREEKLKLHVQQKQQHHHQHQGRQQEQCSPIGCMFRPELTKERVVAVVSQVLCRPGFTQGASDERRLLQSVRSGRIDIRTMSRILRWFAGERATRELRRRGIEFVGPTQATAAASTPYTTGQGMTQLVKGITARNGAGTRFIVCFSSRFDACSSAIAGVLVNSGPAFDKCSSCPSPGSADVDGAGCGCGGGGAISEDARTVSTCSSFSDAEDEDQMGPRSIPISADLLRETRQAAAPNKGTAPSVRSRFVGGVVGVNAGGIRAGGDRTGVKRMAGGNDDGPRGGVVALLLDEKPKHRLCNVGGDGGGGDPGSAGVSVGGVGVHGMPVQEWVEAFGECEGPMLAAWVFPGQEGQHDE
eukprot:g6445.t1